MPRKRRSNRHDSTGYRPSGGGIRSARNWIQLGPNRYEMIEDLSLPDRGRWLAHDPRLRSQGVKRVALLLPRDQATAQLRRSLSRMPNHASSLPQMIDHGGVGDRYCLVIDWVPGIDLREYLRRVDSGRTVRPSLTQSVRLIRGLAHGLRVLHDVCQVVHGDLKPANLIVTTKPHALRAIDYGSSWQIERTSQREPGDGSDPFYTAPEFYLNPAPVGPAADQFSVGVIWYQLLTQNLPFEGMGGKVGHPDLRREFEDMIEPPSRQLADREQIPLSIQTEIDQLLGRMLRWNPEDRFPNSRAWTNGIDRLQAAIDFATHRRPPGLTKLDRVTGWLAKLGGWRLPLDRKESNDSA